MIVLHAIWYGSSLHLWGEDSLAIPPKANTRGQRSPHPFAASPKELKRVGGALVATPPAGEVGRLSLQLPAIGHRPLPSPELPYAVEDKKGARRLAPFIMPTLALAPAQALGFLAALPPSPPDGVALSASLRYWEEAAKFCLELLARGQFVPSAETDADNGLRSVWSPALEGSDVAERFRLLASVMPPVCRSLDADSSAAADLLKGFIESVIDASVRRAVQGITPAPKKGRAKSPDERWLAGLLSEDRVLQARGHDAAHFFQDVRQWTGQLAAAMPPTAGEGVAFRTCFRLEPPAEDDRPGRKQSPKWRLTFHLQALDDRSLLIDATKVWKERSGALTFLKRRFENPQERLLADLGRASRLYPPLESSLKTARPIAFELPTEGAYTFLKEAAPLLEQSGLGVLVPPWWQSRHVGTARLGMRVKVKAKKSGKTEGTASGLMGLDSLMEFDWELALGNEKITRQELERIAALKVPLVQVRGQWVEFQPQQIEAALRFYQKKEGTLAEAMRLASGAQSSSDSLPLVVETERWLATVVSSDEKVEELPPPALFQGTLRPYQVKGFSWLAFLERFGLGACLADDMGLGKTIQLLVLLLHERSDGVKPGPTLLIAPMSVVGNWQKEISRFAPSLRVLVHHGMQRLSGKALEREARKNDIVICTYSLAHRDQPDLSRVVWRRIALDEAQNIKNPSTHQTQAIRSFKAEHRVALTGTPVENRLSELWSIMEFLNPGYLGAAEHFRSHFATPIEKYRDAERSSQLRRLVRPFLLRRLKTDPAIIQDLPEKMEMKVFCRLTREQASLYEAVVKDMMEKIEEAEGMERKGLVLAALTKLKQVCNHPAHFLQDGSPLPERSGKLSRLTEMLEEVIAEGDKALVFTQFAEMGRMLKGHIQEKLSRPALFLHGGTPRKARDEMVEQFQGAGSGPSVFVLSLKAGGLGLNLTAASHVFHFDRWWNPAVENQATDRAFRIGQKKNVQVYKYVCAGTLEERIDQMIEQKKELAESVVGTGENWLTEMSTDQLREVFALSREAVMEE